jgi:predicted PurR-regulated permease PerM
MVTMPTDGSELIAEGTRRPPSRQTLAVVFFAAFAGLVLWSVGHVLAPFLTPILLALVIVTFSYPTFLRVAERLKGRRNTAAAVMLLIITLTIILPTVALAYLLIQQASGLFEAMKGKDVHTVLNDLDLSHRLGFVKRFMPSFDPGKLQVEERILVAFRQIPAWVAAHGSVVFSSMAGGILNFVLMLLAAFFFYTDGERLARQLVYLSPLPNKYDHAIFDNFRGVIQATFRGQMLTALAQGVATGIGLAIAGVPAPVFWGAIAAVFALVPMVGPATIWVPAAIYLFLGQGARGGGVGWGIFLVLWGVVVVGLIDNVVRPWAMKDGLDMPAVVVLFSVLGGLQAWGLVGLVLGPLAFAMLITVAQMYKFFFADELDPSGTTKEDRSPQLATQD